MKNSKKIPASELDCTTIRVRPTGLDSIDRQAWWDHALSGSGHYRGYEQSERSRHRWLRIQGLHAPGLFEAAKKLGAVQIFHPETDTHVEYFRTIRPGLVVQAMSPRGWVDVHLHR